MEETSSEKGIERNLSLEQSRKNLEEMVGESAVENLDVELYGTGKARMRPNLKFCES